MPKPPSESAKAYQEPDFAAIVAKDITPLQQHFLDWVIEKTGVTFSTKKEEAAFAEGIRIGTALRGAHQASPENQERLAEAKAAREAALAEVTQEEKPAKPAKAVKAATPVKVAAKKATPAAEAAPAATRAPAKRAGRRPTAAQTSADDQAPF